MNAQGQQESQNREQQGIKAEEEEEERMTLVKCPDGRAELSRRRVWWICAWNFLDTLPNVTPGTCPPNLYGEALLGTCSGTRRRQHCKEGNAGAKETPKPTERTPNKASEPCSAAEGHLPKTIRVAINRSPPRHRERSGSRSTAVLQAGHKRETADREHCPAIYPEGRQHPEQLVVLNRLGEQSRAQSVTSWPAPSTISSTAQRSTAQQPPSLPRSHRRG
ncbi:hypothetical protein FQN52_004737 [Onygenales sp. PD_12]|nr:hypothetical protein FQN52_004737 [Onygenales sp. PD_12]